MDRYQPGLAQLQPSIRRASRNPPAPVVPSGCFYTLYTQIITALFRISSLSVPELRNDVLLDRDRQPCWATCLPSLTTLPALIHIDLNLDSGADPDVSLAALASNATPLALKMDANAQPVSGLKPGHLGRLAQRLGPAPSSALTASSPAPLALCILAHISVSGNL